MVIILFQNCTLNSIYNWTFISSSNNEDNNIIRCYLKKTEAYLLKAVEELSIYYAKNQLKPNPNKTQSCNFHIKNRQTEQKLKFNGLKV